MPKSISLFNAAPQIPETVKDEAITVPKGETAYWLLLDDADVEWAVETLAPWFDKADDEPVTVDAVAMSSHSTRG